MDIRNIQRTGGKSFVLTLPKDWINSYWLRMFGKHNKSNDAQEYFKRLFSPYA